MAQPLRRQLLIVIVILTVVVFAAIAYGAHAIVLGYPIASEGKVVGAIGLSVHLEAFERVLASIPLPPGSVVTLTDQASVVVARSLDAAQYVGRATMPAGQERNSFDIPESAILAGIDGVERVFGNSVVERGPWLASVGIPQSVAMSRIVPIYQRNFGISVATTSRRCSPGRCRPPRWIACSKRSGA